MNHNTGQATTVCDIELSEFLIMAEEFHGHISPGVVTGGFLVDAAQRELGHSLYLNAVTETVVCLPDAVQLLTPCTMGNGFLQVLDWGKFAVTLYDRESLRGARAWVDLEAVAANPVVSSWFIRKPGDQKVDKDPVVQELLTYGPRLVKCRAVDMKESLKSKGKVLTAACPSCGESYPLRFGDQCLACQGRAYYL